MAIPSRSDIVRTSDSTSAFSAGGGGGGTPAGASSNIQYNNSGVFGGSAKVTINASGNLSLTEYFDQSATGIPLAPPAGNLRWFSRNRAGRILPHVIGPSGVDVALQPAMFGNSIYMWYPGTGTTASIAMGTSWTVRNTGTGAAQSHPVKSSTSALSSMNRALFGTGTTAGGTSGIQSSQTVAWRGNAANLGGFFFFARFGVETYEAAMRYFVGLCSQNAVWNSEPSAVNQTIGICKDSTDTNWQLVQRNTTVTKTDTGIPVVAGQILDLIMFASPNDNKVIVRIANAVDGTVYVDNMTLNSTLPTNTTFLYAWAMAMSTVGTTAKTLALNRIYIETDL